MKDAVSHVYERVLHSLSRAHARGEDFQITKNDGGRSKRNIDWNNKILPVLLLAYLSFAWFQS